MLVAQRLISAKPKAQKYSYRGTYTSTQVPTSPAFSITGVDIGPAAAGRVVVVALTFWYGYNVSSLIVNVGSVTIGGVTASQRSSQYSTTSSNKKAVYIYSAVVPTGTTADIVINHSYSSSPSVAHKSCSVFTIPTPTSSAPVKTGTPSTLADNRRCDMTVTNNPPVIGIMAGIAEVASDPTPDIPIQWGYYLSYIENPTRGLDSRLIDSGTNTHMFVGVYDGIGDSMATYTAEPLAASLSSDYGAYAAWQVS